MIKISFYPESDKPSFVQAAQQYEEIWKNDGKKIVNAIETISNLKFTTTVINAVTFEGISYSMPLRLRSSYTYIFKEATLIHELCHRLLIDNYFYIFDTSNLSEDNHKIIDLILFDLWESLLGESIAIESKDKEISYGDPAYKNAWDWALSFDRETRKSKFKESVAKYANHERAKQIASSWS